MTAVSRANTQPLGILPLRIWLVALISFAVFLVTLFFALNRPLYAWEISLHTTLSTIPLPGWIGFLAFIFIIGSTILGPFVGIWAIILFIRKQWRTALLYIATLLPSLVTLLMKTVIQRPCPLNDGLDVYTILHLAFLKHLAIFTPGVLHTSCFPSGHTTTYIAVFGIVAYASITGATISFWRYAGIFTSLFLIGCIGVAAIGLAKHQALDVVAGYFLGIPYLIILIQFYSMAREKDAVTRQTVPSAISSSA